jgi:hemolysin activation/secretion protein
MHDLLETDCYRTGRLPIALGLLLLVSAPIASAQDQRFGPGSERPELPKYETPAQPGFALPPVAPPVEEKEGVYGGLRIFVKRFELSGYTVFSTAELQAITQPYEGRELTSAEIQEVRRKLTLHYINNGYINSGAVLPDQKVEGGVIKMQIVEGELTEVIVEGNEGLKTDYISDRIRLGGETPLNIKTMQTRMRLMQQNPLIERINAELTPGARPGESVLKVLVDEAVPYQVSLIADNHHSPSVGAAGGSIEAIHRNLTGHGDTFSISLGRTEGLKEGTLSYAFPLNAHDTTLTFKANGSKAKVIEEPFDELAIKSRSYTLGVELTHPFYHTPSTRFTMGLGFEFRKSKSFLLGETFSFSEGVEDGVSKVSVVRFSQNWTHRGLDQVMAARSVFSFGVDAFDSTQHSGHTADSEYVAWLGQFQWARRFTVRERPIQAIFRADVQLSNEPLLPLEQFTVGGARSVRGYRENQLVRDNGYVASLEFRIPVFFNEDGQSRIQLAPFIDYGRSWNSDRFTPKPEKISSAGLGILWDPTRHFHAEAYFAENFREIKGESDEHDLQDSGVHLQMVYRFF